MHAAQTSILESVMPMINNRTEHGSSRVIGHSSSLPVRRSLSRLSVQAANRPPPE